MMKIDDLMGDVISKYGKQSRILNDKSLKKANKYNTSDATTKASREDKVEISQNAKILLQLDDATDKAEKIDRIKSAMDKGTYKPNIEETAKAILKEWMGE